MTATSHSGGVSRARIRRPSGLKIRYLFNLHSLTRTMEIVGLRGLIRYRRIQHLRPTQRAPGIIMLAIEAL